MSTTLRLVTILPPTTRAYDRCFYPALEREGVEIVAGQLGHRWLTRHLRPGDVVHLQFPSFSYAGATRRLGILRRFVRFAALLALVRTRGGRVVWTAHNLLPHERTPVPGLDRLARRIVIAASERVFAHGEAAASALCDSFPAVAPKLTIIQHGNWLDLYRCTRTREEARQRLGVATDAYLFVSVGNCRPYKNIHGLITTFRQVGGDARLLIAGRFLDPEYHRQVKALADGDERIRLLPDYVADDDMQDLLLACDCVVLPYAEILTSGAVMLPLTFGRPVISVRAGQLADVVPPDVGILFDPHDPDGLARALRDVRTRRFDPERIRAHARRFNWSESARTFVLALDAVASASSAAADECVREEPRRSAV